MKKPSIVLLRIGINLHGISSRTYIKIPSPLAFWSDLKILYPSKLNCMEGNDSSSFVSDIINTSTFPLAIAIKWSNIFLMELKLMCPMIAIWMFFSKKTQTLRTKFFVIRSFSNWRTNFTIWSTTPPWPVSFNHFSTSQTLHYLTKLSRSLLEPFGFKCKRLLFKCFLGLTVVLLIKGISFLSHKSFK